MLRGVRSTRVNSTLFAGTSEGIRRGCGLGATVTSVFLACTGDDALEEVCSGPLRQPAPMAAAQSSIVRMSFRLCISRLVGKASIRQPEEFAAASGRALGAHGLGKCNPRPAMKPTREVKATNNRTHQRPCSRGFSPIERKRCVEASVSARLAPMMNQAATVRTGAPPKPHQTERLKAMARVKRPNHPSPAIRRAGGVDGNRSAMAGFDASHN